MTITELEAGSETLPNREAPRLSGSDERPLRILFCVNWRVDRLAEADPARFSPDYQIPGQPYWFFKHGHSDIEVDVLDCRSFLGIEAHPIESLPRVAGLLLNRLPAPSATVHSSWSSTATGILQ